MEVQHHISFIKDFIFQKVEMFQICGFFACRVLTTERTNLGKCVSRQAEIVVSLYPQQVNLCQLHIQKKHAKGVCQNLHGPLNLKFLKTKPVTTAVVAVM